MEYLLRMEQIEKSFPSVRALKGVSLGIRPGEEADLGEENNFIDTGYEIVDINNYKEVWESKTPW